MGTIKTDERNRHETTTTASGAATSPSELERNATSRSRRSTPRTSATSRPSSNRWSSGVPATGAEIIAAIGDRDIGPSAERYTVEQLVPETDKVQFDSPDRVRVPDTATHGRHGHEADRGGQRDAAERGARWIATRRLREDLRRTRAVSPDDDDESIGVVRDWVVDRIRDKEKLPTSRQIRRRRRRRSAERADTRSGTTTGSESRWPVLRCLRARRPSERPLDWRGKS